MIFKFYVIALCVLGLSGLANSSIRDIVECFSNDKIVSGCGLGENTTQNLEGIADGKRDIQHVNQALSDLYKDLNDCLQRNAEKHCSKDAANIVQKMGNNFKKDAALPL